MQDIVTQIKQLRRPRLLIRAARAGQLAYCREKDLPPAIGLAPTHSGGALVMQLLMLESDLNRLRQSGTAYYSPRRHVKVLIALLAEANHFLASRRNA